MDVTSVTKEELELLVSPSRWSKRFDQEKVIEEHIRVVTAESLSVRQNVPCELGIRYGCLPSAKLDVFGTDLPENSPIFVYFSGGYWQDLNGEISAYPVMPLYQKGIATVIVDYDRAPGGTND